MPARPPFLAAAALLLTVLFAAAPAAAVDTESYRAPNLPPLPPALPSVTPPLPPTPPCALSGFVLDCNAGGVWATSTLPTWATGVPSAAGGWAGGVSGWAMASFGPWATSLPGDVLRDEFPFNGPDGATSATIHVHDEGVGLLEEEVVFVVKGGPGGERWICKHTCTVPDTGFMVSVDPGDVPLNVWLGFESAFPLPNLPATIGTISVSFS